MVQRLNATARFAQHVEQLQFSHLSERDIKALKVFILDSLGVGISGSRLDFSSKIIALNQRWGSANEASVWGWKQRVSAPAAAMINAWQLHAQEFDCIHEPAVVHPMATILPTLMAFAERKHHVNGRDFLTAVSAAVDVATTLGEASKSALRFFRPGTCGALGSAMGMAKLAGATQVQLENTLGTIYSQISGTMQAHTEGSLMLPMQIAVNARSAVVAVDMSMAGMDSPKDVLEGEFGFFTLFEPISDVAPGLEQLGKRAQITRVSHKPYPTGRACHGGLDALARILETHAIAAQDIEQAVLIAPPLIKHLTGRRPKPDMSPSYARLCFPYAAAAFMLDGDVSVACFDDASLRNGERLRLAERFFVATDGNEDPNAMTPQTLRIELRSGDIIEQTVDHTIGSPDHPLTLEQHLNKFRRCCKEAQQPLADDHIERIIHCVNELEMLSDIHVLAELCASP